MIKRMDEEAKARFEEMYLTYQDTLRRLAYAYDIPVDDIDDIIQDTFVPMQDMIIPWTSRKWERSSCLAKS